MSELVRVRRLSGTGSWADRFMFLAAITQDAPRVLEDLAALLDSERERALSEFTYPEFLATPETWRTPASEAFPTDKYLWPFVSAAIVDTMNRDIASLADRFNLARRENGVWRGEWMLNTLARTLHYWVQICGLTDDAGRPLPRRHFKSPEWAEYVPLDAFTGRLNPAPLAPASNWLSRDKRALGNAVETMRTASDHHLLAFVRWQVLQASDKEVAHTWAEAEGRGRRGRPPSPSTVTDKMNALADHLDLPRRPRRRVGRPRLVR